MSESKTPGNREALKTKKLYQQMSDLTQPLCASKCNVPQQCCSPEYCEMTIQHAKEKWGVELQPTGHPRLPLMGPSGCTAEPHLRPICTIHVCERHFLSTSFGVKYFKLRDKINATDTTLRY